MNEADYVVVGGGSAGCIVARRLAETGASVVLLEAGRPDRTRLVRKPGMIAVLHSVPQLKKRFDWNYYTVPQQHALNRRIPSTRGKVLGGSSSVNGMLFVRGNRKNYDDWAAEGCTGWGFEDVLPSFKRMESWEDGPTDLRGSGGPIKVTRHTHVTPASQDFIEALSDTAGVKKLDDYNAETQEGVGVFQQSAEAGLRYSSSVGYLDGHTHPNLRVVTGATVTRVLVSGGRATGVELRDRSGRRVVNAAREVVLSAGVFGSPQILMLSGIGPAHHLAEHRIRVHADLPVGENLHDHMFVPMTYLMKSAVNHSTAGYLAKNLLLEETRGDTWLSRTVFEAVGFVRSSRATDVPDLQIHALPWSYPFPNQDAPVRHKVDKRPALTVMPTLIYPE
ncbi:MAG: GMC family oxidoreductase, partial [Nocardioidaceae bacterium]